MSHWLILHPHQVLLPPLAHAVRLNPAGSCGLLPPVDSAGAGWEHELSFRWTVGTFLQTP